MVSTRRVARPASLLLVVFLLAAAGLWLFADLGGSPARAADRPVVPQPDGPVQPIDVGEVTGLPTADSGRTHVEVPPVDVPADEVDPGAAATAEAEGEPPQLVGRVLDPDGTPVPDALVIGATGWVQSLPLEMDELGDANTWLQRVRTKTDADGRFVIQEGLSLGGELVLHVAAGGFAPLRVDRPPPGARGKDNLPVDYGELRLRKGCIAAGRVVDRGGRAVPSARVSLAAVLGEQGFEIDFPTRGIPVAETGADGGFRVDRLELGAFTLLVEAPGQLVGRVTGVATTRPIESLVIVLEAGSSIVGKLVGDGLPAIADPNAVEVPVAEDAQPEVAATPQDAAQLFRVEARPGKPDGKPVDGMERAHGGARIAALAPDTTFVLDGLVDGVPYTLVLRRLNDKGQWERVPEVEPKEGWPGTKGLELRWQPRRTASLRLVDEATGAPVEKALIQWKKSHNDRNQRYLMDPDDANRVRWSFPGGLVSIEGLEPGPTELEIDVIVSATGYEQKKAERLVVRGTGNMDLGEVKLKPAPTVRVLVREEATGAPVAGAKVYLALASYEWLDWFVQAGNEVFGQNEVKYGVTGEDGVAIVDSLPGKSVKVSASSAKLVVLKPKEAQLSLAGGDEVTLDLSAGGTLVVNVRRPNGAPAEGVKVQCQPNGPGDAQRRGGNRAREGVSDAEGRVVFERLPAGSHLITVSWEDQVGASGTPPKRYAQVVVGGEVQVTIDAPAVGTLRGLVLESGQPLPRASLSLAPPGSENDGGNFGGWWGNQGASRQTTSRGDGSYELGPVPAGEWVLTVRHPQRAMTIRQPCRIVEGKNTLDVRLDLALLEGSVIDPDGMPVRGLQVNVSAKGEDLSGGTQQIRMRESPTGDVNMDWDWQSLDRQQTDAEGHFLFRGIATARPLRLDITDQYIVPIGIELTDFADGELRHLGELRAQPAGVVTLRHAGAGQNTFDVKAIRLQEGEDGVVAAQTRVRGTRATNLNSLLPGRYRIELRDRNGGATLSQEVEVVARQRVQVTFE
jgi:protocatechuate 3,4-dioxygenase beta subunit